MNARGGLVHGKTVVKERPKYADNADSETLQNGNYPDPSLTSALPVKRQFRDPYADW